MSDDRPWRQPGERGTRSGRRDGRAKQLRLRAPSGAPVTRPARGAAGHRRAPPSGREAEKGGPARGLTDGPRFRGRDLAADRAFGLRSSYMHSMAELLARALRLAIRPWRSEMVRSTDRVKDYSFLHRPRPSRSRTVLTAEEVAAPARRFPNTWVYEKTRARCRNPIPVLAFREICALRWLAR